MSKHFNAFKIISTNTDQVVAVVWWDGKTIRSTSQKFLTGLKQQDIRGKDFSSGEEFFKLIPHRYSNGYLQCKNATVDEAGNDV